MKPAPPDGMRLLFAALAVAALAGCSTTVQPTDGPKIVVDGEKYITLDAPVGSHMKRRIRIVDAARDPGISPVQKGQVTAETDTTVLPPTATEMQRALAEQPGASRP